MDTIQNRKLMAGSRSSQLLDPIGPDTLQVLTLGDQKGWHFTLLGQAQLPKEPVHLENWLIVPADQDSSKISPRSYEKIQTIFANGIRPKGFVVVHEAPRQLAAPKKVVNPNPSPSSSYPKQVTESNSTSIDAMASALSGIFSTILLVFGAIAMGALMIDPILIAVMEDGSWVEIDRWNTKV